MKLSYKITLVVLLIGVVIFMSLQYGRSDKIKYKKYSSKDSELNIAMDYISDWVPSEHRGYNNNYAQVMFIQPKYGKGIFKAYIVVNVKRESKIKLKAITTETMMQDIISKRLKFKDAKIISESKIKILDTEALDTTLAYSSLDKLYSLDAKAIPFKERIVIIKIGDKLYTLRYMNRAEEFDKFDKAFQHCIKSIKFQK